MKTRVLIYTANDELVRNCRIWFKNDISAGRLIIDHARDKEIKDEMLVENSYDAILSNGQEEIIQQIEKTQKKARVAFIGETRNDVYRHTVNKNSKNSVGRAIYGKRWKLDRTVKMGTLLMALSAAVSVIWGASTYAHQIEQNTESIEGVKREVVDIKKTLDSRMQDIYKGQTDIIELLREGQKEK